MKWVTLPWEREQAYALRRQVFCREQGLFADDDRDEIDDHAHLLVALGCVAGWHDRVVGTVRIHQQSPGVWLGSRLAVDAAYRRQGQLGPTLIRLAVCSAHALG
ncbi:MSMEG_0567/Sll0786 family nitrogen starvation N-acetyltransferase, partial [Klebsiella pneumoniae]